MGPSYWPEHCELVRPPSSKNPQQLCSFGLRSNASLAFGSTHLDGPRSAIAAIRMRSVSAAPVCSNQECMLPTGFVCALCYPKYARSDRGSVILVTSRAFGAGDADAM